MFSLTLSALEYPVLKCCFTASSRARSALDASDAPGTSTETKESVFSPFHSGRIAIIFSVGKTVFFHHEKSVSFLLIILSISLAKTSPKAVGWTELWLLLLSRCLFHRGVICLAWRRGVLGASGGTGTRISPSRVRRESAQSPGPAVETSRKEFTQYSKMRWESGLSLERVLTLSQAVLVFKVYFSIFQTFFFFIVHLSAWFFASAAPARSCTAPVWFQPRFDYFYNPIWS